MPKVETIYTNVLEDSARNHCTNINTEFPIVVTSCPSITETCYQSAQFKDPFYADMWDGLARHLTCVFVLLTGREKALRVCRSRIMHTVLRSTSHSRMYSLHVLNST